MKKKLLFLTIALSLLITCFTVISFAGDVEEVTVVNLNTEWRYLDNNTDPAEGLGSLTAWTAADFDDSSWKTGIGSFGSKNGSIGEVNGSTPKQLINLYKSGNSGDVIPAYFFRTTFNVTDAEVYNKIYIILNMDDSVAIYLNGVNIIDTRNTKSSTTNLHYAGGESYSYRTVCFKPDSGLLKDGVNTLAVQLHNTNSSSSDILFEISKMVLAYEEIPDLAVAEQRVMSPGKDESERNFAWFSTVADAGELRLTEASKVQNGAFPSEYKTFAVTSTAEEVYRDMKYVKKTTVTGLEENTRYAYVIEAGGHTSDIYYFNVGSFGDFEFVYITDPQLQKVSEGPLWDDSLDKIVNKLGAELIVSAGDQLSTPDDTSLFAEFLTDTLSGVTFAPSVGPGHESPSVLYGEHYNLPNLSTKYGVSGSSANYYYVYNNVLFMHLNSSDQSAYTNGEHATFVENAMNANPDVDWNIVVMHYSLFTTGKYANDSKMLSYREALAPKLTELGVDIVLSGHDHIYTRTHIMDGTEVSDTQAVDGVVYQPNGTLYVCAGSSTGTKYYSQTVKDAPYAAVESYKRKAAVKFEVTETTLTMTSYYLDDMSVFDKYTIDKNPESADIELELAGVDVTLTDGVLLNFYIESARTLRGIDNAKLVTKNGKQYYKITVDVAAKEMGDDITVQLMNGDTAVGEAFTFSVKEYAEGILNGNYDAETKALVRAMLNYGAAAQSYFGYKTDALVGTPVTDVSKLSAASVAAPVISDAEGAYIGASLVLEGKMKLRFYFYGNDRSVTVDGKSVSVVNKNGYCYAEISVTPANVDEVYEVKSGSTTVKYSALNYLKNNADNSALSAMVASIYDYSVAAESYNPTDLTPLENLQREDLLVYEYPLDQLVEVIGTVAYNTDDSKIYNYYVYNNGKTISYLIDITDTTFDSIRIELADHDNPYLRFAFLAEMPVLDQPVKYAEGYCTYKAAWINDFTLDIPSDAKYLIIGKMDGSWDCTPAKMTFVKGATALENIQNEELDVYEYPMENLVFDHGAIKYYKTDETKDVFYKDGNNGAKDNYKIAIIDITDCAFDYVSMTINNSFKHKYIGYTFLEELPEWNQKVVYADGYDTFHWTDSGYPSENIEIPDNANYLVVWYMESYYEGTSSSDSRYYPETITFHDEEK